MQPASSRPPARPTTFLTSPPSWYRGMWIANWFSTSFGVFRSVISQYPEIAADFALTTARSVQYFDTPFPRIPPGHGGGTSAVHVDPGVRSVMEQPFADFAHRGALARILASVDHQEKKKAIFLAEAITGSGMKRPVGWDRLSLYQAEGESAYGQFDAGEVGLAVGDHHVRAALFVDDK